MGKVLIYGCGKVGNSLANYIGYDNVVLYDDDITKSQCETNDINFAIIDYCIVSPGIHHTDMLKRLADYNIPIVSELQYCFDRCGAKIISVTGTNGKTTITRMISHILNKCGKNNKLLGNGGVALSSYMDRCTNEGLIVLESSSFMLSRSNTFSPHLSVICNIKPDHLDYHETMEEYIASKCNNYIHQRGGFKIFNADDDVAASLVDSHSLTYSIHNSKCNICMDDGDIVLSFDGSRDRCASGAIGKYIGHNVSNALCAVLVGCVMGLSLSEVVNALNDFSFELHKASFIGEHNGIIYIDDSKATNASAVMSLVDSIDSNSIALIMGGLDKQCDLTDLIASISNKVKHISCVGHCKDKIYSIAANCGISAIRCSNMREAVIAASQSGCRYVALSPACSSLDEHASYVQRGEDFCREVEALQNG